MNRFRTRKRYRLTFVNENTFNAVWTVKLSRLKVWLLSALTVASIAALVSWILVGTPISMLLPGYLRPEQRREHVNNTARVDSLAEAVAIQNAYLLNINNILEGTEPTDTPVTAAAVQLPDTLIPASAAERRFAREWADRERFNLSVLTPLAAEGMTFRSPVNSLGRPDTLIVQLRLQTLRLKTPPRTTVVTIHSGTVVDTHYVDTEGFSVTVMHQNNFLSKYRGLGTLTVEQGQRITDGQALGLTSDTPLRPLMLEIWHNGLSVNPRELIAF